MTAWARSRYADLEQGLSLTAGVQALALLIIYASSFVDILGSISTGTISSQGILTVAYFCGALILLPAIPGSGGTLPWRLTPLLVFVFWVVVSLTWTTTIINGVQNAMVITTFLLLLLVADAAASADPRFVQWLSNQLGPSAILASVLYGASVCWWGPGTSELIGARSFGLFALLGVAHFLAEWRYGRWTGLLWATLITVLIGLSESRLALGIAVALFPLSQIPTRRLTRVFRMAAVACGVIALSYAAFEYFDALRDRFLIGDTSVKFAGIGINVSGRLSFWRVTMESINDSPIVGKGAGSTEGLIESVFLDIRHPHNDYLRVVHDYGVIGVGLWIVAILTLLISLWRSWRRADREKSGLARFHLAALLGLIAFILAMSMENALVYTFVTAPLALLIGSAFGSVRARRASCAR